MPETSGNAGNRLYLIGGGGHCRSVIEAAFSAGIEPAGIIDLPKMRGEKVLGIPVAGDDCDLPRLAADPEASFLVTVGMTGDPSTRIKLQNLVELNGGRLATVVASTASVSRFAETGAGTVVLHHASVNAGARIGRGCIINTGANVEHDAVIGDFCHVSTGAIVNGGASVGEGCFIGSGAVVRNGVSICAGCVVGAGAVVCRDIKVPGTYVGVPARPLY